MEYLEYLNTFDIEQRLWNCFKRITLTTFQIKIELSIRITVIAFLLHWFKVVSILWFDIWEFYESKIARAYLTTVRTFVITGQQILLSMLLIRKWHTMMIEEYDPTPNKYQYDVSRFKRLIFNVLKNLWSYINSSSI